MDEPTSTPRLDAIVHTPGPWVRCEWAATTANPGVSSSVCVEIDGVSMDICRFDLFPETGHEHEGNARLIEAAPDLLAACVESLSRFEHDGWPLNDANTAAIQLLKDAIKKATTVA